MPVAGRGSCASRAGEVLKNPINSTRRCRTCGRELPAGPGAFRRDARDPQGIGNECLRCNRAAARRWAAANRERHRVASDRYAVENREHVREAERRRRRRQRKAVVDAYRSSCCACGATERVEFHHVFPDDKKFGLGGGPARSLYSVWDELAKCVPLCRKCHRAVHRKQPDPHVWLAVLKAHAGNAA